jgi:hypothetical protein
MIILDAKHIREVTSDGIRYVDEQGKEQFIDFAVCYERHVKENTSSEYWEKFKKLNKLTDADWDNHVESVKRWRKVGVRDITGSRKVDGHYIKGLPYIEFDTQPRIRFEFTSLDEWYRVEGTIRRAKWRTMDLS